MTDTPTTQTNTARPSFIHEDRNQQARGVGVQGASTPTGRVLDFRTIGAEIQDRPEPTRVVYKPGEATCHSREYPAAVMETLLQAACIDLELDPTDLSAAADTTRSGWLMADKTDDATSATVLRRVALVQGLSVHWLKIGLRQLVYSGWQRPLSAPGAETSDPVDPDPN